MLVDHSVLSQGEKVELQKYIQKGSAPFISSSSRCCKVWGHLAAAVADKISSRGQQQHVHAQTAALSSELNFKIYFSSTAASRRSVRAVVHVKIKNLIKLIKPQYQWSRFNTKYQTIDIYFCILNQILSPLCAVLLLNCWNLKLPKGVPADKVDKLSWVQVSESKYTFINQMSLQRYF